jgi:hypothetical protein
MTGHRLNLGGGRFPKQGFENADGAPGERVDHVVDASRDPRA